MERVVERGVLPWIDGRRGGCRIFDYEMVFVDKVILSLRWFLIFSAEKWWA